jgi:thiol-disulfide isomerase/thioredoxin
MKMRWTIAVIGVAALAALTVTTQMPWLTDTHPEMAGSSVPAAAPRAGETASVSETLTCPADAKAANLTFALNDHLGRRVELSQYKGKVILLDFWATWCGPCKVEMPHFVEFQEQYGKDGLQIIGVSVDDTPDKLVPFVREMKINYPILQGLGHDDLQEAFGPMVGIPLSVMISRDGRICATHAGLTGKDVFEREIKALL